MATIQELNTKLDQINKAPDAKKPFIIENFLEILETGLEATPASTGNRIKQNKITLSGLKEFDNLSGYPNLSSILKPTTQALGQNLSNSQQPSPNIGHLFEDTLEAKKRRDNLLNLLRSSDEKNINLAFELMQGDGIDVACFQDLQKQFKKNNYTVFDMIEQQPDINTSPSQYWVYELFFKSITSVVVVRIEKIPENIQKLSNLTELICRGCTSLTALPNPLPTGLTELICRGCTSLTALPNPLPTGLTKLNCQNCTSLTALPNPLPTGLTKLNCQNCTSLTSLPNPLPHGLKGLYCQNCKSLDKASIQMIEKLKQKKTITILY